MPTVARTGQNPNSHGNTRGISVRSGNRGGKTPPPDWQERFLKALSDTQLIMEACKAAGVSRAYVYGQRKKDVEFAERWEDVIERGTEILEQIAVRRAAEGSDTLMIFLLKARRPNVYRENVQHDHHHVVDGTLTLLDGRNPIEFEAANRREAARMLLAGEQQQDDVIEGQLAEEGVQ